MALRMFLTIPSIKSILQEAEVVCRQLGYDDGLLETFRGHVGLVNADINVDTLRLASNSNRVMPANIR